MELARFNMKASSLHFCHWLVRLCISYQSIVLLLMNCYVYLNIFVDLNNSTTYSICSLLSRWPMLQSRSRHIACLASLPLLTLKNNGYNRLHIKLITCLVDLIFLDDNLSYPMLQFSNDAGWNLLFLLLCNFVALRGRIVIPFES